MDEIKQICVIFIGEKPENYDDNKSWLVTDAISHICVYDWCKIFVDVKFDRE